MKLHEVMNVDDLKPATTKEDLAKIRKVIKSGVGEISNKDKPMSKEKKQPVDHKGKEREAAPGER